MSQEINHQDREIEMALRAIGAYARNAETHLTKLRQLYDERPEIQEKETLWEALDIIHSLDRKAMIDYLAERRADVGLSTLSDYGLTVRVAAAALGREYWV